MTTSEKIRAAIDTIRNPFGRNTQEQELLVFEAAEKWAEFLEEVGSE